jgi:hypothetical protein
MNDLTTTILLLMLGAILLGILLGRKESIIKKLEHENKHLRLGFNEMTQIIRASNVTGRIPKELEDKDLEDK